MFYTLTILLFFLDLLVFIFIQKWILSSLFIFFLITNFLNKFETKFLNIILIVFLLIQDYFYSGIVGSCLFYVLPILIFAPYLKKTLNFNSIWILGLFLILIQIYRLFFVEMLVLGRITSFHSTLLNISINIFVGSLILLGMRGNRS